MAQTGANQTRTRSPAHQAGAEMKRAAAAAAALVAVLLVLFYDSAASMVRVWITSATFGHGFLIPPIVAYLFWHKRHVLAGATPRPSFWGIAWIGLFAFIWLLGQASQTNLLQHLGLVGMLQGTVLAVLGPALARRLLFPLGYMLFMVPFGDFAIRPLQDFTAQQTTTLVRWSGIPVLLENWVITIPGGAFLVAEACAGVRFLIATIALGVLIAGLFFEKWWKRLLFVALSIVVPIGANVLRAYGIVIIAHLSDFKLAVGIDHIVYGFVFLSFVMGVLIGIAYFMRDNAGSVWQTPRPTEVAASNTRVRAASSLRLGLVTLLAISAVGLIRAYEMKISAPSDVDIVGLRAPRVAGGWRQAAAPLSETAWRARHPHADADGVWRYRSADGGELSLYIAYYADERPGKELISTVNRLTPFDEVDVVKAGRLTRWSAQGLPPPAYRVLSGPGGGRVVWFWYCIDGEVVADPLMAKVLALRGKLAGGGARSAIVAISAETDSPQDTTMAEAFADASDLADTMRGDGLTRLLRHTNASESGETP